MNELVDHSGLAATTVANDPEAALDALREAICQGGYAPGDRLPPERLLARKLGVSRSALRRGLDALARDGAIRRHVGRGTFIATDPAAVPVHAADLSRIVTPHQMMRARLALEPAIAREAALGASGEGLDHLRAARDTAARSASWGAYEVADDAFHRAIARATANPLMLALFDQLNAVRRAVAFGNVVRRSERPPSDHTSFTEHQAIVAAIESRAAEAAHAAMRRHLKSVSDRLFGEG